MKRIIIGLIIAISLLLCIGMPVNAYDPVLTKYEYLTTGGDGDTGTIYGGNQLAMQFTVGDAAHTISKLQVALLRVGSPGTVTVSIREANAGIPIGLDLATGTLNGNSFETTYKFKTFVLNEELSLEANTQYAIIVSAYDGTDADYVSWRTDSGGSLANAVGSSTDDGGITWTSESPYDFLFTVYGYTVLDIIGAQVFEAYKYSGDLLFAVEYINVYPPYANNKIISDYFTLQLLDSSGNVLAASPLNMWGYRPASLYLSAQSAQSISNNGDYKLRIYGTFTGHPYVDYDIESSDWKGTNLEYLDKWIRTTAGSIEEYHGYTGTEYALLTSVVNRDELLTNSGGAYFTRAIPGLSSIRPDIFQTSQSKAQFTASAANMQYDTEVGYRDQLGDLIADDLDAFGTIFGISGGVLGGYAIAGLLVVVILFGLLIGNGGSAMAILVVAGLPLLFVGTYTRMIGIMWVTTLGILMFAVFAWRYWLTKV